MYLEIRKYSNTNEGNEENNNVVENEDNGKPIITVRMKDIESAYKDYIICLEF